MKKAFLALFALVLFAFLASPAIVRLNCASITRFGVELNQSANLFVDSASGPVKACDPANLQLTVTNATGVVKPLSTIACSNGVHVFNFTPGVSANYTFTALYSSGATDSCVAKNLV
ncbi:hypothetical protein HY993_01035, partial [Candidatus Micrarchaeota archaeon]|nr:hypothetical protein [Candidatus Micrarchaeota archaeon]